MFLICKFFIKRLKVIKTTTLIKLNLMPSNQPFLSAFLPKLNPPIKKEIMVESRKDIFKMVDDNHPVYSKKVKRRVDIKFFLSSSYACLLIKCIQLYKKYTM